MPSNLERFAKEKEWRNRALQDEYEANKIEQAPEEEEGVISRRRIALEDVLVALAYALLFIGATAFPGAVYFLGDAAETLPLFILLIPPVLFIWARKVKSSVTFLVLHVIITAAAFYAIRYLMGVESAYMSTPALAAAFIFSFRSCYSPTGRQRLNNGIVFISAVAFILAAYIIYRLSGVFIDMQLSLFLIAIIALFLLNYSMTGIDGVLQEADERMVAPSQNIISFNNKITAAIICVMILLTLVSRFFLLDRAFVAVYNGVDRVGYSLSRLFNPDLSNMGYDEWKTMDSDLNIDDARDNYVMPNLGGFVDNSQRVAGGSGASMLTGVWLICIAAILSAVGWFVYDLIMRFRSFKGGKSRGRKVDYDGDIKIIMSAKEKAAFVRPKMLPVIGLTYAERIRRMFYHRIRKYEGKVPFVKSDTAGNMTEKLKTHESIKRLTRYYNKARYSHLEVTKGDYDHVRVNANAE